MRFVLMWFVVALVVYLYRYILSKKEKKTSLKQTKNVFVSCFISTVLIGSLYILNNIQGL